MTEIIFKIIVTITVLGLLIWFWTLHVDPIKTITGIFTKLFHGMFGWVATRDQNAIYQNGKPIGKVTGQVIEKGDKFIFHEIINVIEINKELPIEYRREKLKITSIHSSAGLFIEKSVYTSKTIKGIMKFVECKKITKD
jgi:hypothetical protein